MLFVTLSTARSPETQASDEGTLHWIKKDEVGSINLIQDVQLILTKLESINQNEIFTAKSLFDGK